MRSRRAALTLLEIVIASAILMVLVGAAYGILHYASAEYGSESGIQEMDGRAREVFDGMGKEVRMGGANFTAPPWARNPGTTTTIDGEHTAAAPLASPWYLFTNRPRVKTASTVAAKQSFMFGTWTGFSLGSATTSAQNTYRNVVEYRFVADTTSSGAALRTGRLEKREYLEDPASKTSPKAMIVRTSRVCGDVLGESTGFVWDNTAERVTIYLTLSKVNPESGKYAPNDAKRDPTDDTNIIKTYQTTISLRN